MNYLRALALLGLGITVQAEADVWKWIDAKGNTHYVDTMKTIYTWIDGSGEVHYSDTPEREDAVTAELIWHSSGTLDDLDAAVAQPAEEFATEGEADPGEPDAQAADYYCRRATEIYESYVNAPQLFRTGPDGQREYLSEEDAASTIAETRARKEELCSATVALGD
jgi:hypothetical protein